jgi:ubiquinone/menaquinone biosynthesis C-methylase UbiE
MAHEDIDGMNGAKKYISPPPIPDYLETYYWWAYVRPWAIDFFENSILVNLILWGHYHVLKNKLLADIKKYAPKKILQIACVYGDLTTRLAQQCAQSHAQLGVVDIVPAQLANLDRKLDRFSQVHLMCQNSSQLMCDDQSYDCAFMFFLLHEQPPDIRAKTFAQAWRIISQGGHLIIIDFATPAWWHPARYFWMPFLNQIEPFGADLWNDNSELSWIPQNILAHMTDRQRVFGGLFQILTFTKS